MSKVGKNVVSGGNFHLRTASDGSDKRRSRSPHGQAQEKSLWLKSMASKGKKGSSLALRNKVVHLKGREGLSTLFVALYVLFPESFFAKMMRVKNLPESTLQEKSEKEKVFRKLLLEQFDIHEVKRDMNCALRAIICGLNPDLENNAEEITAYILRGDLIDFIKKHPEYIEGGSDPEVVQEYCNTMSSNELPIGIKEIRIISDLLETPIHIFRSNSALVDSEQKICPGKESTFGSVKHASKKPISIYYDPNKVEFMPLYPKKQSKFSILRMR